jgi:hypothetical protein
MENAPRGTFLWNGNPQELVYVENYFVKKKARMSILPL